MSNPTRPPEQVPMPCTPAPPYSSPGFGHTDKDGALRPRATRQGESGLLHDYQEQSHSQPDASPYNCHARQKQFPHTTVSWGKCSKSSGFALLRQCALGTYGSSPQGQSAPDQCSSYQWSQTQNLESSPAYYHNSLRIPFPRSSEIKLNLNSWKQESEKYDRKHTKCALKSSRSTSSHTTLL